jgi:hypothetical protein
MQKMIAGMIQFAGLLRVGLQGNESSHGKFGRSWRGPIRECVVLHQR